MKLFAERYPKPVLPVGNRPLIAHQIEMLRSLGVRRIIVVIGHLGSEIVKAIDRLDLGDLKIEYHDQGELLGIAHAVGQLESKMDGPFFLFLGDIYFASDNLGALREPFDLDPEVKAVLAVREGQPPEAIQRNFAVFINDQGNVRRVVEKPHHARTDVKGCGLYLFDLEIFDAIRRTQRTALRDEYELTDSIQILIDDGYRVRTAGHIRHEINLTFPEDILRANLAQLDLEGQSSQIAAGADFAGAEIVHSVIGSGVEIASGSRLESCLVLPETRILKPVDWRQVIAAGELVIHCDDVL
jgi:NDP-sugar pyrophosphorylase family protein